MAQREAKKQLVRLYASIVLMFVAICLYAHLLHRFPEMPRHGQPGLQCALTYFADVLLLAGVALFAVALRVGLRSAFENRLAAISMLLLATLLIILSSRGALFQLMASPMETFVACAEESPGKCNSQSFGPHAVVFNPIQADP